MNTKLVHFTTVHRRNDTRIFFKQCISLTKKYGEVKLYVADGLGNNKHQSIEVVDVGGYKTKWGRFLSGLKMLHSLYKEKASIYTYHDPELFFVALILKSLGKKIVFDAHENIRLQLHDKDWLPLKPLVIYAYPIIDWLKSKLFYITVAESSYETNYGSKESKNVETIMNYPSISLLNKYKVVDRSSCKDLFYLGSVSELRGAYEMIDFLAQLKDGTRVLHIIGPISNDLKNSLHKYAESLNVGTNIKIYGAMSLVQALEISKSCVLGFAILKPVGNYLNSYSTKIFEYMAIGLPFIVSNFEIYKKLHIDEKCAFLVDPELIEIIPKVSKFLKNKDSIENFSRSGIELVKEYNWENEEKKLFNFYDRILGLKGIE
ncbi:glycosyltransferase [Halobacteriovorax sp.]|uniref:glycosyltransferase n=1 Tax=Halobacteriovorax sp. TaxID=2020862 RepID=UPI003AF2194A